MNIDREDAKHMVGKGWSKIIDMLYDELPIPDKLKVHQVKSKFGTLRFYTSGITDKEHEIVLKAEAESAVTCEDCGKPAVTKTLGNYWLVTLCDDCYDVAEQHRLATFYNTDSAKNAHTEKEKYG